MAQILEQSPRCFLNTIELSTQRFQTELEPAKTKFADDSSAPPRFNATIFHPRWA